MSRGIYVCVITTQGVLLRLKYIKFPHGKAHVVEMYHIPSFYSVADVLKENKWSETIYWDASTFEGKTYKEMKKYLTSSLSEMKKILSLTTNYEVRTLDTATKERQMNIDFNQGLTISKATKKYMEKITSLRERKDWYEHVLQIQALEREMKEARMQERGDSGQTYLTGKEMLASFAMFTLAKLEEMERLEDMGLDSYTVFAWEDMEENSIITVKGKEYAYSYEDAGQEDDEEVTLQDLQCVD